MDQGTGGVDIRVCPACCFFDQRRNNVALASFAELLAEEVPPLAPLAFVGQVGVDLLSARRAIAERGNVEVAVQRKGERARNWRGG